MKIPRRRFLHLTAGALALPAVLAQRFGANLSVEADHHDRAVRGRRLDRRDRPHPGRADAGVRSARPIIVENATGAGGTIGVGRARPRRARRLHHQPRPERLPRHHRRDLQQPVIQPADRFRAGVAAGDLAVRDHRQEGHAGEQPEGTHRLAEGQSRTRRRSATPARAASPTLPGSYSRTRPARSFSSCPIAAPARRCRTWWRARST